MDCFLEQWLITHQQLDIKYIGLQRLLWGQENVLPQGKIYHVMKLLGKPLRTIQPTG